MSDIPPLSPNDANTDPETVVRALSDDERFACYVARLLSDNGCEDVVVLDIRKVSQVADFFVIASGTSDRQMFATADDIKILSKQEDQGVYRMSGNSRESTQWVVVDCVDVVIHLQSREQRAYYDLDSLWGDAEHLDWRSPTSPGQFARLRVGNATKDELAEDPFDE